jgi:hypothetical protein
LYSLGYLLTLHHFYIDNYPSGAPYDYDQITSIVVSIKVIIDAAVTTCQGLPVGAIGLLDVIGLLVAIIQLVVGGCGHVFNLPGIDQVQIKAIVSVLG